MPWKKSGVNGADLADGTMHDITIDDIAIVLLSFNGRVSAFQGRCPHESGILAHGTLTDGRLVCPLHGATFDAGSGRILADPDGIEPPSGDVPSLVRYPTRLVDAEIEVEVP